MQFLKYKEIPAIPLQGKAGIKDCYMQIDRKGILIGYPSPFPMAPGPVHSTVSE